MATDIKKWLMEEMGFPEAEAAEMAPKFTAERVSKLDAGYVASNDRAAVAAAREEVETQKKALAEANERLNLEMTQWAQLTASEKEASSSMRASLHEAQQEVLALQQSLTTVAAQAGIDVKTVLPNPRVETKPVETKPAVDTSRFVDRDQFSTMMQYAVDLPASLQFIADQHRELTGNVLDTRGIVAEIKKRASKPGANVDPVQIWEEMHNIPTLRTQRDEKNRAAEIKAAEERGEERARSNMAIPGASTSRSVRPSPVLAAQRTSVLKRPQAESGTMATAAALRSGKYREKAAS